MKRPKNLGNLYSPINGPPPEADVNYTTITPLSRKTN